MIKMMRSALLVAVALVCGLAAAVQAQADKQRHFATAEAAANALTDAIRKDDDKTIEAILGSGWHDLIPGAKDRGGDVRERFLAAWDKSHRLVPKGDDTLVVEAGTTGWQMPVPIVKDSAGWRYDVEAGRKEIEAREIGRDELTVIQALLAIVDSQREYADLDPMKTGIGTYARHFFSTSDKKNGLYWETKAGEPPSPLGWMVANAQPGDAPGKGYYGYHFRMLYGQGPSAPGGAYSYVVDDRMVLGFAVVAWPVTYGESGVMTFVVSQSGDVYERDLGPETSQTVAGITQFDPDKGWHKADMTTPP
jgi:hypothetical protein